MSDTPGRNGRRWLLGLALGTLCATPALAEATRPRPPRRVRRAAPAQRRPPPPAGTRAGPRAFMSGGGGDGTGI
jgi:hypothetical protein